MSCGIGHRHGLDLALLWVWQRPAAAAQNQLLAWELPYASGVTLKRRKKKKKKKERKQKVKGEKMVFPQTPDPANGPLDIYAWTSQRNLRKLISKKTQPMSR